jgi:diguanylate cyclase (GGDEF)-like protein
VQAVTNQPRTGYTAMTALSGSRALGILSKATRIRRSARKKITKLVRENKHLTTENRRLVEENRRLHDELQKDRLTKLWNRLGLRLRWEEDTYTGVLVVDVDEFKRVNDTYGHNVGDAALIIITKQIRALALGARTGGDEFVALVKDEDPMVVAEKIRAAINQPVILNGKPVTLSVSIGVYMVRTGDSLSDSINRADQANYQSKRAGRNRVTVWRESDDATTNRNRRGARIR